jgi:hypothetical protein
MLFIEEYKSFIRFANLYLYFSDGQSTTVDRMLRERPLVAGIQAICVGDVEVLCRKRGGVG